MPDPLLSERLELRTHRVDDLDDLLVFHSDAEVIRYIPWPVRTRDETAVALERKLGQVVARESGEWIVRAIVERTTGVVIGEVLLKREDATTAEIGYVIRRDRWGHGLASEAVRTMIEAAVPSLGLTELVAMVEAENHDSLRLLERLGFKRLGFSVSGVQDDGAVRLTRRI
ncbi:MAG: GNAT family N-acetyltransferase [Pseudolysinimonas sp.]|uniref:GNAT family N-acetyltransferase n=1 Tax=Pseudolysinimonas sp. TaxID=2680009 RepID=UPI0032674A50